VAAVLWVVVVDLVVAAVLWAKVVDNSEEAHTEPAEGEVHVGLTTHAAPEAVAPEAAEPDVALDTTRQECCLMWVLVEITSRRQLTLMWVKVQGTSRWCR